ncbi:hypothetical protein [Rhizohabitans arisaemae]|uniref:hypothetical protein n=1 Tax=Rhizohabitans arisaemae TaxID=2720610 RepID=UPI0024B0C26E|nr:hypothetical protein [Rhizohabitans arisaemae]
MTAAALLAATGFTLVALFQVALAAGAPWGRAAWGGGHSRLPARLRVASAFSALVLTIAALIVLERARVVDAWLPAASARWATWGVTVAMAVSAIGNLASPSRWERSLMAPVASLLAVLSLIVAVG